MKLVDLKTIILTFINLKSKNILPMNGSDNSINLAEKIKSNSQF